MYIVIAGGGLVGRNLARSLVEAKHDVVVIDKERSVCEYIYAKLGAVSINGNATNIDILEDAGIHKADVAVALTRTDADNLSIAVLAKNFGVPRVFARMRNAKYESAYHAVGVESVVNVVALSSNRLLLEIEQPEIKQVAMLAGGRAAVVLAKIPDHSPANGKTIAQIAQSAAFPEKCVITGILQGEPEQFVIPRGNVVLNSGDSVFLAAHPDDVRQAANFFLGKKK